MNIFRKLLSLGSASVTLIGFFATTSAYAAQSSNHVIGEAYGLKSAEFLYRETHCGLQSKLTSEVVYQQSDGTLIARKILDYQSGKTTPSFVQHNIQANEKIAVSLNRHELSMSVKSDSKQTFEKKYPLAGNVKTPIVIDAGFDIFIRDNWDKLVSGEAQMFQFPLASRSKLISLQVKASACNYETESDQCFTLEPSNWFIRMLASPIELGYDSGLERLTRYRGLSNINDKNGKGLEVDISYRYLPTPGAACDTGQPNLSVFLSSESKS